MNKKLMLLLVGLFAIGGFMPTMDARGGGHGGGRGGGGRGHGGGHHGGGGHRHGGGGHHHGGGHGRGGYGRGGYGHGGYGYGGGYGWGTGLATGTLVGAGIAAAASGPDTVYINDSDRYEDADETTYYTTNEDSDGNKDMYSGPRGRYQRSRAPRVE